MYTKAYHLQSNANVQVENDIGPTQLVQDNEYELPFIHDRKLNYNLVFLFVSTIHSLSHILPFLYLNISKNHIEMTHINCVYLLEFIITNQLGYMQRYLQFQ
jgi:hypothetical protein